MAEYLDIEVIEKENLDLKENDPPTAAVKASKTKKPSSAYTLFISSLRNDIAFQESLQSNKREFLQAASHKWNELGAEEKQKFVNEA